MHHYQAKNGSIFNFNSDMSGDVHVYRAPDDAVCYISGFDILEFVRWWHAEYGETYRPAIEGVLWLVSDPGPESELADILFKPGARLRDWCVGAAMSKPSPPQTLHVDEEAALADALLRLHRRDHPKKGTE